MGRNSSIERRSIKDKDFIISLFFFGLAGLSIYTAFTTFRILLRIEIISSIAVNIFTGVAFIIRKPPIEDTFRNEYLVPTLSFIIPFSILNLPLFTSTEYSTVFGLIIALPSIILAALSIYYLRQSFAVLPAVRTIIDNGPYSVIRHPLYLAELLYIFGFMILAFNLISVVLYIFCLVFAIWRIRIEENKLGKYPGYARYMKKVKYMLIPLIL